jgi:glycosyltransferase involved in cell wall biosynthesis
MLVGQLPHEDMPYWFSSADFIISGSYKEGTSIVLAEAMSCGCIPVVTAIPAYKVMTGNGHCGVLYEPGNEDALLRALVTTTAINIKEERQKVLEHFHSKLSFKAIAADIEAVITNI